jgi:hypothetical protein
MSKNSKRAAKRMIQNLNAQYFWSRILPVDYKVEIDYLGFISEVDGNFEQNVNTHEFEYKKEE